MLLCYLAHDAKLNQRPIASIVSLDRFRECKYGVKAKNIYITREQHLLDLRGDSRVVRQ